MTDNLLDDLTIYCLCGHVDYGWYYSVGGEGCPLCRAKTEIERLRALGDGLYFALNHLRHGCNPDCEAEHALAEADEALEAWEILDDLSSS